ncbi:MAG: ABC transporter ATP-binding protein [Coriobacteriia bacterium]|nr:ABC transporter ATP-binding protein [Coriobacteriia bacterium]
MITLRDVTKRYGEVTAVDGVSFEVPSGEVCVLIGPSGCGKTTTLRMINRLIEPTSGSIEIDGQDVMSVRPEELRRHIGYVIQSVGLFPHLTVAENVATVPKLLGWERRRYEPKVRELLGIVGLPPAEYADKYPRQLSGGQAQRVGVARALVADPPLLLMDEPFGAVDPLTRERLQAEFVRIQRELKKTVIFVTHDVDEAIKLADRIALMRSGNLEQYDTPETLLDHPASKFVHDFMGSDRALKRLGRARVANVMRTVESTTGGARSVVAEACGGSRFVYLTDERGVLEGWVDCKVLDAGTPPEEAGTTVDWHEAAVHPETTLKDALSRMLGFGFRNVAVVDADGRLVGEVSLAAIEGTMADADTHIANLEEGEVLGAIPEESPAERDELT